MLTIFTALCQNWANLSSLKLSVSAIIDDAEAVSIDLRRAYVGDMRKINNHANPLNIQWACSPSLHLHSRHGRILPLWSCLSPQLLMMWRQSVLICKELTLEIWKKLTIALIPWIHSEHVHLLCSFMPEMGESPLFEVICLRNYWWYGDSQCWFAKS